MKNIFTILFTVLAVAGCAQDKQNSETFGSFNAFEDSIIGSWTTGCKQSAGFSQKWTFTFDGKNGVYANNTFDKADCRGPADDTDEPSVFSYSVTNKPNPGESRLNLKGPAIGKLILDAVLVNGALTLTDTKGFKYELTRVGGSKK